MNRLSDYSPLVLVAGTSFVGTGILYPVWCLGLGHRIVSRQIESASAASDRERPSYGDEKMRSV